MWIHSGLSSATTVWSNVNSPFQADSESLLQKGFRVEGLGLRV